MSGIVAEDVFQFASGDLTTKVRFLDADRTLQNGISWDGGCHMDGIVGFAPSKATSALNKSSPFLNLVEEGVLDANLFALHLRQPPQMSIGGVNNNLFRRRYCSHPTAQRYTTQVCRGKMAD